MQIKRFEAKDMAEALRMVKREFGENAVILSAKEVKKQGSILGAMMRKGVEITAATDRGDTTMPIGVASATRAPMANSSMRRMNPDTLEEKTATTIGPPPLKTDIRLHQASQHIFPEDKASVLTPLASLTRRLLSQGVAQDLIEEITDALSRLMQADNQGNCPDDTRGLLKRFLADKIRIADPISVAGAGRQIIALVGPAGVGKTTTLVKVAAKCLQEGLRVGMICLDHHHIGAVAQLKTFSGIMEIPIAIAEERHEVKGALQKLKGCQVVLVDTPGIGITKRRRLQILSKKLSKAKPNQIHLVLSAGTKEIDLNEALKEYALLSFNRVLFTKIDETRTAGNMLNLLLRNSIATAYIANGCQIPEALEHFQVDNLIDLLMGVSDAGISTERIQAQPLHNHPAEVVPGPDCFVANKNSDIYHHPHCKSVKRINTENIIVFQTAGEAAHASFKPCRMCCLEASANRASPSNFLRSSVGRF